MFRMHMWPNNIGLYWKSKDPNAELVITVAYHYYIDFKLDINDLVSESMKRYFSESL